MDGREGKPCNYRFVCPHCGHEACVFEVTMQLVSALRVTDIVGHTIRTAKIKRLRTTETVTAYVCGHCLSVVASDVETLSKLISRLE